MISIFAKPPFLNTNPSQPYIFGTPIRHGHLMRVSSLIRGIQMADSLKCKLNPIEGFENDVCIYVKPHVRTDGDFKFEGKPYLDIVDGWDLIHLLRKHPEVPVICMSQFDCENVARYCDNRIVFIPQHHINHERVMRNPEAVVNVGIVGTEQSFPFVPEDLKLKLTERGMKLVFLSKFDKLEDIKDFYKDLYVQIVWRPYRRKMGNPLKLVNGASFGVPTIAYYEDTFKEMNGYYIPVKTINEFVEELDKLRSDARAYGEFSKKIFNKAEEYHIDKIADLYRKLT